MAFFSGGWVALKLAKSLDQTNTVNEKCAARLISSEPAHQINRAPPPQTEEAVAHGAIHDRRTHRRQRVDHRGNLQQPSAFSRHSRRSLSCSTLVHTRAIIERKSLMTIRINESNYRVDSANVARKRCLCPNK